MNAINNPQAARRVAAPVMDAMQNASVRTGVDFDYLVDVARVESGYNPTAKASTSSARGLYQFTKQTWLATLERHGADLIEPMRGSGERAFVACTVDLLETGGGTHHSHGSLKHHRPAAHLARAPRWTVDTGSGPGSTGAFCRRPS